MVRFITKGAHHFGGRRAGSDRVRLSLHLDTRAVPPPTHSCYSSAVITEPYSRPPSCAEHVIRQPITTAVTTSPVVMSRAVERSESLAAALASAVDRDAAVPVGVDLDEAKRAQPLAHTVPPQ